MPQFKDIKQPPEIMKFSELDEETQSTLLNEYLYEQQWNITPIQKQQLEEWTNLKISHILFDSEKDNWAKDTSTFNEKIIGKKQLVFVIEDENDEKFGYFFNPQIIELFNCGESPQQADKKCFHFNLESNERLSKPMKFEIKNMKKGGISLFRKNDDVYSDLITIGEIFLSKENWKIDSNCEQHENYFNYHSVKNALCGIKSNSNGEMKFIPKRFVVIQMI